MTIICEVIKPTSDQCTCTKLMSESDCKAKFGCSWSITASASGACINATTPNSSSVSLTFCQLVNEPEKNCSKTKGCAYIDEKCIHFTGCSAYVKITNQECQSISNQCITDGKQCANAKPCIEYLVKSDCETNLSISGILKCKWENDACRDYNCSEAEISLTTNSECSSWLSGCVTTGKGCTTTLGPCSGYQGNDQTCAGLKGTDGNCEGEAQGTNCKAKVCSNAPTTTVTDSDNGKGCVVSPLPACSTYNGDNTTCVGYIGSDGTCEGDVGATNCRARTCSNAPASNNSNQLCNTYKSGCVTTGKGCTATLGACSSYQGTSTSCSGYIGTDGFCKGVNTTEQPCQPKVCTEAANTLNTDSACAAFQVGCKTTGKGCVSTKGPCSSYTGTTTTCQGYIGTDGNCKGTDANTAGPCSARICSEAPTSTTTNEACVQYQRGCVTNGAGCVSLTSCLNTIKKVSCEGTEGCSWNSICVPSSNCSDFQTVSICLGNKASGKPCFWTGSQCRNLTCTDASSSNNTDSLCNTFLAGCITNGKGCVVTSTTCSLLQGTKQVCAAFTTTTKCYNTDTATSTTACINRICSHDTTSTSDTACDSFLSGCRTKGTGCIDKSSPCSAYQGTQSTCDSFRGSNVTKKCWNTDSATATTACIEKTCIHKTTASNDSECEAFLSGCIYNGEGCVEKTSACSAFKGNQSQCGGFKAENGQKVCWSSSTTTSGACRNKDCADAANTLTSDNDCSAFLTGCLTNGAGCVSSSALCSSYSGTMSQCSSYLGNNKKCYKDETCDDRQCSDLGSPTDNTQCITYLPKCRFFKGKCVDGGACASYTGTSLSDCQDVLDSSNSNCWWVSGGNCISRSCDNAPSSVASQANCDSHVANCLYEGNNKCVVKGTCSSYKANGNGDNCKTLVDSSGNTCWFVSGTNCTDKTCANASSPTNQGSCDSHKANCKFFENACVTPAACSSYTVSGTDAEKLTKCKAITNTSNKACTWTTGSTCTDATCSNAVNPTNQASCDSHLAKSCSLKFNCKTKLCSSNTTATTHSACTTWMSTCQWNGTTGCEDKKASCTNITPPSVFSTDALKKSYCESYTPTNADQCSFKSGTSTCVEKCAAATGMINFTQCETFLSGCQYDGGSSCQKKVADCTSVIVSVASNQAFVCQDIVLTTTQKCEKASANTTSCQNRTCSGNTLSSAQSGCDYWLSGCQWTGTTGCEDKKTSCSLVTASGADDAAKTTFCQGYTISSGQKCLFASGQTKCSSKCTGNTTATTRAECDTFLAGCQWNGTTGCEEQAATCSDFSVTGLSVAQQSSKCSAYIPKAGGTCYFDGNSNDCYGTCTANTTATSFEACTAYGSNCVWKGTTGCDNARPLCSQVTPVGADTTAKQNYCSGYKVLTKVDCQYVSGSTCVDRTCSGASGQTSSASCNTWKSGCQWNGGTGCADKVANCAAVVITNATNSANKQSLCDGVTTTAGIKCQLNNDESACQDFKCNKKTNATNQADCTSFNSTCRYNGTSTCVDAISCASYVIPYTLDLTLCDKLSDSSSISCTVDTFVCQDRTCSTANAPTSQTDCDNWKTGCKFIGNACTDSGACSSYTITGSDNAAKRQICTNLGCGYVDNASVCTDKACSNITPTPTGESSCTSWISTCRWNGTACVDAAACTSYTFPGTVTTDAAKTTYCSTVKDNQSTPKTCVYVSATSTTTCQTKSCANYPGTPSTNDDCKNHDSTCTITNEATPKCIASTTACSGFTGTPDQCKSFNGNGKACWQNSNVTTSAACVEKACTHNTIARTNEECEQFMTGCKTNGQGCVAQTTSCTSFLGNVSTCLLRKASDGVSLCKVSTSTTSGNCKEKSCYDDANSTTDAQCKAFMEGCVTNGAGCIPSTEPCSAYKGDQTKCAAFTGNSKKCWNTSGAAATSACRDKTCVDDVSSTTDPTCAQSSTGCITKGAGCIPASSPCSAFSGTQTTCGTFKGINGTKQCWNTSAASATTACVEKTCSLNTTATTDADCDTFLPKAAGSTIPKCVTNGSGCVDYPIQCQQFQGTHEECGKFTASDGPCKSSVQTGKGPCTPKICSEALNTNNTDALCKAYHPSCVTNGYGCVTLVSCNNIQDSTACSAKSGCSWVENCRSVGSDCMALTTSGASVCVNTPVSSGLKSCSWYNNACRALTCEDLPASLTTHEACKAKSSTCTTTGTGCILMGTCSTYSNEQICKAAKTTEKGDTCIWDNNACRPKKCTDAGNGTTNEICNTFLSGCKTNGQTCIDPGFNCTSLTTAQACIKDSSDKPCLFVENVCYNYVKCEDISMNTHSACQKFSPQCTTDGTKCISIASCEKTVLQISCIIGTDGTCGWLPATATEAAKCQKFGQCTDAGSSDKAICQAYGPKCITDGTKCIEQATCATYQAQIACNDGGTDGPCMFSQGTCRQRECTDATTSNASDITTHAGCYAFIAKTKCTTNGTSCIPLAACTTYAEAGCVLGTDGTCTFDVPVGSTDTNATKSCRLKVCQDFKLTTSAECAVKGCVSNGTNCITKGTCSSYTKKESCNGGGTDGQCAFTPSQASSTDGSCKLMSSCSDANNDSLACNSKSSCLWKVSTSGSSTATACNDHDCSTKANGSECNPVLKFDGSYEICIPSTSGCVLGSGSALSQANCYGKSLGTYTWNSTSNQCQACFTRETVNNNTGNPITGSTSEILLQAFVIVLMMIIG